MDEKLDKNSEDYREQYGEAYDPERVIEAPELEITEVNGKPVKKAKKGKKDA